MATKKTKAELTAELVAEAVGAGKKAQLESVDFSDPNRPLTCLEVDFPILPINQIAQIEGNAGKPIYQMVSGGASPLQRVPLYVDCGCYKRPMNHPNLPNWFGITTTPITRTTKRSEN